MKTPLRYPGGKSRAVNALMEYVPDDCGELCSPFLGGGSFELALAQRDIKIHGYDAFKPIVWFWQALLKDPARLAQLADSTKTKRPRKYMYQGKEYKARGLLKKDFERFRDEVRFALKMNHPPTFESAAKVYAINRSSFSGATFAGGFSERASYARFTDSQIDAIRNFKVDNFTVKHADFKDSMKNGPLAGFEVDSMKVTLKDGSFHPVDSDSLSFELAARLAFKTSAKLVTAFLTSALLTVLSVCLAN